jgi:hypothetical protein
MPGESLEILSAAEFQEALRHVVRFREQPPVEDPLAAAVARIEQNPAFAQSRLLARVLDALTYQQGEFRRAEVAAFDAETFAMVVALMDKYADGTMAREKWVRAVEAARAVVPGASEKNVWR